MKRVAISFLAMTFITAAAFAQDDMKDTKEKDKIKPKESQEIIIRKKGDKDINVTVEIKGDKILVNGKPLAEFKDDNIVINNRKVTVWDGDNNYSFNFDSPMRIPMNGNFLGHDTAWKVFTQGGKRALLGVSTEKAEGGVVINNVTDESGADKAGLKEGDVITKVDDKKIETSGDLSSYISSKKPKDEVTVYYKRDGKANSAKAILGENEMAQAYSFRMPEGMDMNMDMGDFKDLAQTMPRAGAWNNNAFGSGTPGMLFNRKSRIGLKIQDVEEGSGVKVLEADEDSPAAKAGLKKDDVITEINGKKVANTDEAREQLKPEEGKNSYTIKAKRNGSEMNFEIKIPKKLKTANL